MRQDEWCLPSAELVHEMARRGVVPTAESPLAALPEARESGPAPAAAPDRGPRFVRALEWIAAPALEIGVLRGPTPEPGPEWLYRADGGGDALASYGRTPDGDHRFRWTGEDALLAELRDGLQLQIPAPRGKLALDLAPGSLAALLGALDALREHELQSLLARLPDRTCMMDATWVADALGRSGATGDLRWIGALGQALTPFDLEISDRSCEAGLVDLARAGLLVQGRDGHFEPAPAMLELAARTGAPVAYAALHARFCDASGRPQAHVAVVRGLGGMLLLEYEAFEGPRPRVSVRDATAEEAELALSGCLSGWGPAAPAAAADRRRGAARVPQDASDPSAPSFAPGAAGASAPTCTNPHCGRPLTDGAPFCAWCGAAAAEASRAAACAACGRQLKPGARFCTACGAPRA